MMPEMNGYEVLERLKAERELRNIPVIMISALNEMDSVIRCIELGAEDYLPKPFNPTLLRARLGACLEKKRLRDEVRASLSRLEQELSAAARLQMGMLPRKFPACTTEQPVDMHAVMEPAREVGGDFYDCFYYTDHQFCFLVGDVSGKGAEAAMFMARTRSLVRMAFDVSRQNGRDTTPADVLETVNRELCRDNDERMFVTIFLGLLDTRTGVLIYTNAGHPLPHLLSASGAAHAIAATPDMPLGVRANVRYRNGTVTMQPGEGILVTSDGVVEATNEEGAHYTVERLASDLSRMGKASARELVATVASNVRLFTGAAPKADDVAVLALRWRPTASPA
jgi:sigma-B regulation protein RsbU (phosphoserine phosphatase)